MKKVTFPLALLLAAVMITGCSGKAPSETQISASQSKISQINREDNIMYSFKACSPDLPASHRGKIRNLYEDKSSEYHSLFIGQVLSRFGEPDYITEDNENLFSKAVSAEDKNGNSVYLEIYYGPSGPAIGGDVGSDESRKAADELAEFIMSAEPKDFEYKSVYEDFGVTVTMGVENGKPYYQSDIPADLV